MHIICARLFSDDDEPEEKNKEIFQGQTVLDRLSLAIIVVPVLQHIICQQLVI